MARNGIERKIQRLKRQSVYATSVGIFLLCFLLAACGTPPPAKHPLSQVNVRGTAGTGASGNTTDVTVIKAIQVQQSNLSTYPGGQMSMTIVTSPYALCSFSVAYGKSTPSTNIGIVPHTANANGMVSWTWHVDGDVHTGTWPLTVSAVLPSGSHTTQTVQVHVVFPPITVVSNQTNLAAYPKNNMSLTISTAPNVQCALALNYGPTKPVKSLKSVADSNGVANWTWHVGSDAPIGVWPLTITVTLTDGEQGNAQVNMTVM